MARLWILRVMLAYSMVLALLLSFSLPSPGSATGAELLLQVSLLVLSGACLVALLLLTRRPDIGWRIAGVVGLFGVLMLCLRGWALLLLLRTGGPQQLASALVSLSLGIALVVAGACSLWRGPKPVGRLPDAAGLELGQKPADSGG